MTCVFCIEKETVHHLFILMLCGQGQCELKYITKYDSKGVTIDHTNPYDLHRNHSNHPTLQPSNLERIPDCL
jgi:hypothetical protein